MRRHHSIRDDPRAGAAARSQARREAGPTRRDHATPVAADDPGDAGDAATFGLNDDAEVFSNEAEAIEVDDTEVPADAIQGDQLAGRYGGSERDEGRSYGNEPHAMRVDGVDNDETATRNRSAKRRMTGRTAAQPRGDSTAATSGRKK